MIEMITESEHVYAGKQLLPGDKFLCEPQHVILMTVRRCARKVEEAPTRAQEYQTRDMVPSRRRRRNG